MLTVNTNIVLNKTYFSGASIAISIANAVAHYELTLKQGSFIDIQLYYQVVIGLSFIARLKPKPQLAANKKIRWILGSKLVQFCYFVISGIRL